MGAVSDAVWSEQGTTPDAIEAALRQLLMRLHAENGGLVPARALNMIVFADASTTAGRSPTACERAGRYHASRLVVLSYEQERERLDARARSPPMPGPSPVSSCCCARP